MGELARWLSESAGQLVAAAGRRRPCFAMHGSRHSRRPAPSTLTFACSASLQIIVQAHAEFRRVMREKGVRVLTVRLHGQH